MAKAAGRCLPAERQVPPRNDGELMDLAARLENLARAQDEARDALGDGESNDAVARGRLFAAVARLNPRYAAGIIRTLAQSRSIRTGGERRQARPALADSRLVERDLQRHRKGGWDRAGSGRP
ncbi:MAG: hypothetical protein M0020_11210 [Actinomycetota bacterium]|nr:hypothetical protein [Actinomycetota bacterium]